MGVRRSHTGGGGAQTGRVAGFKMGERRKTAARKPESACVSPRAKVGEKKGLVKMAGGLRLVDEVWEQEEVTKFLWREPAPPQEPASNDHYYHLLPLYSLTVLIPNAI